METPFVQKLKSSLAKSGYRSLRAFYLDHKFNFSYEYLRQIFSGEKFPKQKKVRDIAQALQIAPSVLLDLTSEAHLEKKIRKHYSAYSQTTRGQKLAEKTKAYATEQKSTHKLLKSIDALDAEGRKSLEEYLRFLKRQCQTRFQKEKS